MSSSMSGSPSGSRPPDVGSLLAGLTLGLVDDAAVFPPGDATVPDAVESHRGHKLAPYAEVVGPLLVRASTTVELLESTRAGDDLSIGLIADEGLTGLVEAISLLFDHDDRATLAQVEIALPAGHDVGPATRVLLDQLAFSATAYVEVPRTGWDAALDVLAEDGAERAKYRTGGATAQSVPNETELAAFVAGCLDRRLTFKLTAGLHRAVRHTTPEGWEQHGFLNVLAAVTAGLAGAGEADLVHLLAERSPVRVVDALAGSDVAAVRRSFASFGCCGVTDPVDDLVALGLLGADWA
jgi:hypothetical protein